MFHRNLPVVPVKLLRYYREWEFRWGGTGRDGSGWFSRPGCWRRSALLGSLGLLAVANDPPRLQTPGNTYQAPTSAYLPPARMPGGGVLPGDGRRSAVTFAGPYPSPYPVHRGGLVHPGQGLRH